MATARFTGDENGNVKQLHALRVGPAPKFEAIPGTDFAIDADLVLIAMGFMTSIPGVFAAGDLRRGQSLVVWAIAEGRKAARGVDKFLMGETHLQ